MISETSGRTAGNACGGWEESFKQGLLSVDTASYAICDEIKQQYKLHKDVHHMH
jgi:hypothetical protein